MEVLTDFTLAKTMGILFGAFALGWGSGWFYKLVMEHLGAWRS